MNLLLQVSHSKNIVDKSTIMQLLSGEIDIYQVTTTQKQKAKQSKTKQ
jgi:hypothetical protein